MNDWIAPHAQGSLLLVYIQPGASRTQGIGLFGNPPRLKIKIAAQPVEGKANEALLIWLAEILGIKKSAVSLLRGEQSRHKDIVIELLPDELEKRLRWQITF